MKLFQNSDAVFMSVTVATNITVLADQALLLWDDEKFDAFM